MMKYAEAVDLYKKYYDEYMNDPKRVKQRKTLFRYAQFLPMLGLGGVGTGIGSVVGGAAGLANHTGREIIDGKAGDDARVGAAVGGIGGGLLGLIMGIHMKNKAREALEIQHRDEAWRYAAALSGRVRMNGTTLL